MTHPSRRDLETRLKELGDSERNVASVFHVTSELVHGDGVQMVPGRPERVLINGEWRKTSPATQNILHNWPLVEREEE